MAIHDGRFGTATTRIRVRKIEDRGVQLPRVCSACPDAPCLAACPVSALSRDAITSAVLLAPDACIVCPACADACPHGVVFIDPAGGTPLICDLCDGDPACVKRCVTGALTTGRQPGDPHEERGDA